MNHWARKYIGRAWKQGECWFLLQDVFRERHGIEMPDVRLGDLGDEQNVAAIKVAAERSGWRRVAASSKPKAEDIILMVGLDGSRHVGYMIATIRGLRLLHADGHMTDHGPVGSVVSVPLEQALADGYSQFECWRKASS